MSPTPGSFRSYNTFGGLTSTLKKILFSRERQGDASARACERNDDYKKTNWSVPERRCGTTTGIAGASFLYGARWKHA